MCNLSMSKSKDQDRREQAASAVNHRQRNDASKDRVPIDIRIGCCVRADSRSGCELGNKDRFLHAEESKTTSRELKGEELGKKGKLKDCTVPAYPLKHSA